MSQSRKFSNVVALFVIYVCSVIAGWLIVKTWALTRKIIKRMKSAWQERSARKSVLRTHEAV